MCKHCHRDSREYPRTIEVDGMLVCEPAAQQFRGG